jgi:hypothetical protein
MESGAAFEGFSEGHLGFRPTYKFDRAKGDDESTKLAVNRYDSGPKQRVPAWTDRVLYRRRLQHEGGGGGADWRLKLDQYDSVEGFMVSDHKPVFAAFRARISNRGWKPGETNAGEPPGNLPDAPSNIHAGSVLPGLDEETTRLMTVRENTVVRQNKKRSAVCTLQ